jgi:hypothetical protein
MRYFPLFLDLQDRDVLLLGGGEALEGKEALLRRAGARIRHVQHFEPCRRPAVPPAFPATWWIVPNSAASSCPRS